MKTRLAVAVARAATALAIFSLPVFAQEGPGHNKHDSAGRPLTAMDQQGRQYSYTYDRDGTRNRWFGNRLVWVRRPDGTLLEFGYNEHNERGQTRVTRPGKPPETCTYPPQPLDPGQVTYDELGRLTSHTNEKSQRVAYTYDSDGSRSTWRGDRLLRVDRVDGTLIEFAYSPSGDRGQTKVSKPGQPPEIIKYPRQPADESRGKTHDHLGRWASETVDGQAVRYTYEADGSRHAWVDGRLVQVLTMDGTLIEHAYGADGFRGQTRTTRPGKPPEVTDHPRPSEAKAAGAGAAPTTAYPPPSRSRGRGPRTGRAACSAGRCSVRRTTARATTAGETKRRSRAGDSAGRAAGGGACASGGIGATKAPSGRGERVPGRGRGW